MNHTQAIQAMRELAKSWLDERFLGHFRRCARELTALANKLETEGAWLPISSAPKDQVIEVYAPAAHGLNAMVSLCEWHEDAGFCVCELRESTHWKPHAPPNDRDNEGERNGN